MLLCQCVVSSRHVCWSVSVVCPLDVCVALVSVLCPLDVYVAQSVLCVL